MADDTGMRPRAGSLYIKLMTDAGTMAIHCPKERRSERNIALFDKLHDAINDVLVAHYESKHASSVSGTAQ